MSPSALAAAARTEQGRHAVLHRHYPDQPEMAQESLRRLRALRAEIYVRALVDSGPPLDLSQRRHLADILLGKGVDAA